MRQRTRSSDFVIGLLFLGSCAPWCGRVIADTDGAFPVKSNLRAGVAKVDITPAQTDGVTVAGHHRVVHGVRDPLRAGVLVLDDGETKAVIVTLDALSAWDEMVKLARERIAKQTGVPEPNILVAVSHHHSGPGFSTDSAWGRELIDKLHPGLRRRPHQLQHQSTQGDRRPRRRAAQSRRAVRPPRQSAAVRRRHVADAHGGADARGVSSVLFHVG
jgi:hypothetical protein